MYKMILEHLIIPGKQGNYKKPIGVASKADNLKGLSFVKERTIRAHKRIVTPMDGGISITYKSMSS